MSQIIPPDNGHTCDLPDAPDMVGALTKGRGCEHWWRTAYVDLVSGWGRPEWVPVRWYHWRLRRRIREARIS